MPSTCPLIRRLTQRRYNTNALVFAIVDGASHDE
jgi:hypothetical protein